MNEKMRETTRSRAEVGPSTDGVYVPNSDALNRSPSSAIGQFFKRIRTRSKSPAPAKKSPGRRNHQAWSREEGDAGFAKPARSPSGNRLKQWIMRGGSGEGSWIGARFGRVPSERKASREAVAELRTADKRGALSEEDLVSKSLASELLSKSMTEDTEPLVTTGPLTNGPLTSCLSQDSVFDVKHRQPSYIRVSCALNGYRNFRPVLTRETPSAALTANICDVSSSPDSHVMGSSMVERRLAKFNSLSNGLRSPSSTRPDVTIEDVDCATTPVCQLISQFNQCSPDSTPPSRSARPKLKPPPIPDSDNDSQKDGQDAGLLEEVLKATAELSFTSSDADYHRTSEQLNGVGEAESTDQGLWYKDLAVKERRRLLALCDEAETDMDTVSGEAADYLRTAVGKSKLLLRKKFAKFEELTERNLNGRLDEPCPVTADDLEGFWQLLRLELANIHDAFRLVARLRANNWDVHFLEDTPEREVEIKKEKPRAVPSKSKIAGAEQKARQEARQRLRAAKMAARQKRNSSDNNDVQIFVSP